MDYLITRADSADRYNICFLLEGTRASFLPDHETYGRRALRIQQDTVPTHRRLTNGLHPFCLEKSPRQYSLHKYSCLDTLQQHGLNSLAI